VGRKVTAKGRNKYNRFVKLDRYFLKSAAYRSLSTDARALYTELKMRFNGSNNGDIAMSNRDAQQAINLSAKPVTRAFNELEKKGFIKRSREGLFTTRMATTWTLTEESYNGRDATKEYMRWQNSGPENEKKKQNIVVESTTYGGQSDHDGGQNDYEKKGKNSLMVVEMTTNSDFLGGRIDHTYNIPPTRGESVPPSAADDTEPAFPFLDDDVPIQEPFPVVRFEQLIVSQTGADLETVRRLIAMSKTDRPHLLEDLERGDISVSDAANHILANFTEILRREAINLTDRRFGVYSNNKLAEMIHVSAGALSNFKGGRKAISMAALMRLYAYASDQ